MKDQKLSWITAMSLTIFGIIDGFMLAALPRLGFSYGALGFSWFLILCTRLIIFLISVLLMAVIFKIDPAGHNRQVVRGVLIAWGIVNIGITAVAFYGMYIEPFDLRVTELKLTGPAFYADRPLRIIQLADLHVERTTKREDDILARLETLRPDLIVLTGDYVNFDYVRDPLAIRDARSFLAQLHAPLGVYAIRGSELVDVPETMQDLFAGLEITVMTDEARALSIGNGVLYLAGVEIDRSGHDRTVLAGLMRQAPAEAYTLLLYHTPDLVEAAVEDHVDLYLAGHTHGGQIRFPLVGPLVTFSTYGRKYACGLYRIRQTTLYTCRGLGMEGLHLPRARLLCPPEIVVINIQK